MPDQHRMVLMDHPHEKKVVRLQKRLYTAALMILLSLEVMKKSGVSADDLTNVTVTTEGQTGQPTSGRTERSYDNRDQLEGGINVARPPIQDNQPHIRPYFDENVEKNITFPTTKTAYIHCRARNMGNTQISWVRQRDMQILTVGMYTYTSDRRFASIHADNTDDWTLELRDPMKADSGVYECQINTEPKRSLAIQLNIVAVETHIPEGPVLYVKSQNQVNITCRVNYMVDKAALSFVFWYHDGKPIAYDQRIKHDHEANSTVVSRLYINSVTPEDAGIYVCKPSYATPANITLHVLEGEKPALMTHRINASQAQKPPPLLHIIVLSCSFLLFAF